MTVRERAEAMSAELLQARLDNWPEAALRPLENRHDMLWRWVHEEERDAT